MIITLNGIQLDFTLEKENTVGEVLSAIEQNCAQNNATITSISIDDKILSEKDFSEIFNASLDSYNTIALETISEVDVFNLLANMQNFLQDLVEKMLQIPVLLQSNKDTEQQLKIEFGAMESALSSLESQSASIDSFSNQNKGN